MAKAHVPLLWVEATAPAELAAVQVDEAPESLGEYRIPISPRPDLPVGPFQFEVQVRAVTPDGAIHPCAAIEVSGEMQATTRVFPKVILLVNRHLGEEVACQVNLTLASKDWKVERVETDSEDASVTKGAVSEKGDVVVGLVQKITRLASQKAQFRIVVCSAAGDVEMVTAEIRYFGIPKQP